MKTTAPKKRIAMVTSAKCANPECYHHKEFYRRLRLGLERPDAQPKPHCHPIDPEPEQGSLGLGPAFPQLPRFSLVRERRDPAVLFNMIATMARQESISRSYIADYAAKAAQLFEEERRAR